MREDSSRACVHPRLSLSLWTDRRAKQVLARFLSVRKLSHKPTQTHPTTLPKAGADSLRDRTGWRRQAPRIVTGRGNDTRELTPLTHTARDLIGAPHGAISGLWGGQGEHGATRGVTAEPMVALPGHLRLPGIIKVRVYVTTQVRSSRATMTEDTRAADCNFLELTYHGPVTSPRPPHSAMLTEAVADAKACTTLQNRP